MMIRSGDGGSVVLVVMQQKCENLDKGSMFSTIVCLLLCQQNRVLGIYTYVYSMSVLCTRHDGIIMF